MLECNPDNDFPDVASCVASCKGGQIYQKLDQCASRSLAYMQCFGQLSCDDYILYVEYVENPDGTEGTLAQVPCLDKVDAFTDCDHEQPFDEQEISG